MSLNKGRLLSQYTTVDGLSMHARVSMEPLPQEDPIVSQQWAEEVVKLLPDGQLAVVPGAGHTMNYSQPLELTRVTRAFLNATKSRLVN